MCSFFFVGAYLRPENIKWEILFHGKMLKTTYYLFAYISEHGTSVGQKTEYGYIWE